MALKTINIPNATRPVGVQTIGAQAVPAGAVGLTITLATAAWTDPASILTIEVEMFDGDWEGGGRWSARPDVNGEFLGKNGTPLSSISVQFRWPATVSQIRATVTVEGAPIQTSGSLVVD